MSARIIRPWRAIGVDHLDRQLRGCNNLHSPDVIVYPGRIQYSDPAGAIVYCIGIDHKSCDDDVFRLESPKSLKVFLKHECERKRGGPVKFGQNPPSILKYMAYHVTRERL